MPEFRPFKGFLPQGDFVRDVVLGSDEQWKTNSNRLKKELNPWSFNHVMQAADPSGDPEKLTEVCALAKTIFEHFVSQKVYAQDEEASYYIYQTSHKNLEQTGLIGLSSIKDYNENRIKKHEHVRDDRVQQLHAFLSATALYTTPVFLTYAPDKQVNDVLFEVKHTPPIIDVKSGPVTSHQIWKISSADQIALLEQRFKDMDAFYIADGHHRAAVAAYHAQSTGEQNGHFLTILIPSNDLTIYPFYRRVHQDKDLPDFDTLCRLLGDNYHLQPVLLDQMYYQYLPQQHFLLCNKNNTFLLQPKHPEHHNDPLKDLDVSLLQDNIISKILGINNPKADKRLSFGPMSIKLEEFKLLLADADTRYIFVPRAPLPESIFEVADRGEVMPPKSTSFEPKIKSGLVLYRK